MSTAPPSTFALAMSPGMRLAALLGGISFAIALASALAFGGWLLYVGLGLPSALLFLALGAPRSIEVSPDTVVLRFALRRDRRVAAKHLQVQTLPDELLLVDGSDSWLFPKDCFPLGDMQACAEAIAAVAGDVVRRPPVRRSTTPL